ncbi:MAG: hypothetical protein M1812_005095 [Candelaria pacifica]|nr:MAG: hypothetical protein M1812_005095 [Candelaria pacifica]
MSGLKRGQKKVSWTPENDNKLLLQLMDLTSKPDYVEIATMFASEGATAKAIEERHAKLKRWKKNNTYPHTIAASSSSNTNTNSKLPTTTTKTGTGTTASTGTKLPNTKRPSTKSAHTGSEFVLQGVPTVATTSNKKRTRAMASEGGVSKGEGGKVALGGGEREDDSQSGSESGSGSGSEVESEDKPSSTKKLKKGNQAEEDKKEEEKSEDEEKKPVSKSTMRKKTSQNSNKIEKGKGRGGKGVKKTKIESKDLKEGSEDEGKGDLKDEGKVEVDNGDERMGFGGAKGMVGDSTAVVIDQGVKVDEDDVKESIKKEVKGAGRRKRG